MSVKIKEAVCYSGIGKIRNNNEDNYFFNGMILDCGSTGTHEEIFDNSNSPTVCFGVFDGMGGHSDGQIASYTAANSFRLDFESVKDTGMLSESFFPNTISHMNNAVHMKAEELNNNMGTTCALLGICEEKLYVCNVGDSRIYRLRDEKLIRISVDHTEDIPPFMKASKHVKPGLYQYIGMSPEDVTIEPYLIEGTVKENDIYLLCSDGLTDMINDDTIEKVLRKEKNIRQSVKILIDQALSAGGRDNITVILVRVI